MFASRKTGSQARHEARCGICSHSERLAIEKAFLHHQMSVADITRCYGVGHDAVYRHLRALNLLAARHRNWSAMLESDNSRPSDGSLPDAEKTVLRANEPSTIQAKTILELLHIPASDEIVMAVERAIENEAEAERTSIDMAANTVFVNAALVKIAKPPENWLHWFQAAANAGHKVNS